MSQCDDCVYFCYDEDAEDYFCEADMDEDDYARLIEGRGPASCPYYQDGDEYKIVRHQM